MDNLSLPTKAKLHVWSAVKSGPSEVTCVTVLRIEGHRAFVRQGQGFTQFVNVDQLNFKPRSRKVSK